MGIQAEHLKMLKHLALDHHERKKLKRKFTL